jgi:hypothetical protein
MPINECKWCKQTGHLVMQFTVCDEVCEACGEWQEGVYNDIYMRVG